MTKYIHKDTGAIIEVASVITGEAWEEYNPNQVEDESEKLAVEAEPIKEEVSEGIAEPEEFDLTKMTVKELKEYAKENEIELPADAKKDEIIEVIADAFN